MNFLRISTLISFQKIAKLFDEIWILNGSQSRMDSFFLFLASMESLTLENISNHLFQVRRVKKLRRFYNFEGNLAKRRFFK